MGRRLVVVPIAIAVGAFVLALPLVVGQTYLDGNTRFVPRLDHTLTALAIAGMFAPIIQIGLLTTVLRRALATRTRGFRWLYAIGTVIGQLGTSIVIIASLIATDPHFLDGNLIASSESPDGARTAYLYSGFMCGVDVYVATGGWTMTAVAHQSAKCGDASTAEVVWRGDSVAIVGPDGRPLPADSWPAIFVVH